MKDIYLDPGELSSRTLRNAERSVEDAVRELNKLDSYGALANARYFCDGYNYPLFSGSSINMADEAISTANTLLEQIHSCQKILDTGPDALEEIDRDYKGQFREWEHGGNKTGGILPSIGIIGIGYHFGKWLSSLFGHKTTTITVEREPVVGALPPRTSVSTHPYSKWSPELGRGQIRLVQQTGTNSVLEDNGWGSPPYPDYAHPYGQCNSASASMALSYLGVNASPADMIYSPNGVNQLDPADYGTVKKDWTDPTDNSTIRLNNYSYYDKADIDYRLEYFETDGNSGDYSPVLIRYNYDHKNGGHWVMLVGKNEDGTYNVIGPGGVNENKGTTVSISPDGHISGGCIAGGSGTIHRYAQYERVRYN